MIIAAETKMILLDMNQVILHNLFARMKSVDEVDEELVRHMVVNSIRPSPRFTIL